MKAGLRMSFGTASVGDNEGWWPTGAGSIKTASGMVISPNEALFYSAYFACLRNISEDIAKMPRFVMRRISGGKERRPDHPVYDIIHTEPNEEMTAINFFETLTHHAIGWKRGAAEVVRNFGGEIDRLNLIDPNRIEEKRRTDGTLYFKIHQMDMGLPPAELEQRDILNIHGIGRTGTHSYALSHMARENVGLALQLEKHAAKYFANDAANGLVLLHPGKADVKVANQIRSLWNLEYAGSEMAHKVKVLMEDIKVHQFTSNLKDAQSIETQQHMVEALSRWFRMPPHKIQHLLRATFSNIESQNIEYVTDTLLAWLVRVEQELTRKLLTREERRAGYFIEHLVDGLLRGDSVKRMMVHRGYANMGAINLDEVRDKENFNAIPGGLGKIHWIPRNMMRLEDAVKGELETGQSPPSGTGNEDEDRDIGKDDSDSEATFRPLFEQAIARIFNKEIKAVVGQAKKKESADFNTWAVNFFESQRDFYIQEVDPIATAFGKGIQVEVIDATAVTLIQADSYIEQGLNEILDAFEHKDIVAVCNGRQSEGVDLEVNEIMEKIKEWRTP